MVTGAAEREVLLEQLELGAGKLGTLLSHQCFSAGEGGGAGWCCVQSFYFLC